MHTQGIVAARLDLRDLIGAALPLTRWWHRYLLSSREGEPAAELLAVLADPQQRAQLREALIAGLSELLRSAPEPAPSLAGVGGQGVTGDLLWLAFVAGTIALLQRDGGLSAISAGAAGIEGVERAITGPSDAERVDVFLPAPRRSASSPPAEHLWSVNRNRRGDLAMTRSTATVKADAARAVFGVTGQGLRWAVLDSGIDARHLAFRARDRRGAPLSLRTTDGDWSRTSRVVATHDFTRIRELLAAPSLDAAPADLQLRFVDPAARAAADLGVCGRPRAGDRLDAVEGYPRDPASRGRLRRAAEQARHPRRRHPGRPLAPGRRYGRRAGERARGRYSRPSARASASARRSSSTTSASPTPTAPTTNSH